MPDAGLSRTFPHGVTCWVDTEQSDVDAALAFYGPLFGWTFDDAMPSGGPSRYVIAKLDGRDVAAIASGGSTAGWHTYVAVDDADTTTDALVEAGARLLAGPVDAGPGGRTSTVADPEGVEIRLWQARRRLGVQAANEPGAWNFSDLHTASVEAAAAFYGPAFGWVIEDQGWSTSIRVPGYGDHLEATVDPGIRTRQASAPAGFADVIGGIAGLTDDEQPHWHVTFTVADRDATAALVESLGGTVLSSGENDWTRHALVRDPQGAVFTASQFAPKEWG